MSIVWDTLNERQRLYLQALYTCDQSAKAEQDADDHTPASDRHWIPYAPAEGLTPLYGLLRAAGDSGEDADTIWLELERRLFVQCRYVLTPPGGKLLEVQLTRKGRNLVRRVLRSRRH